MARPFRFDRNRLERGLDLARIARSTAPSLSDLRSWLPAYLGSVAAHRRLEAPNVADRLVPNGGLRAGEGGYRVIAPGGQLRLPGRLCPGAGGYWMLELHIDEPRPRAVARLRFESIGRPGGWEAVELPYRAGRMAKRVVWLDEPTAVLALSAPETDGIFAVRHLRLSPLTAAFAEGRMLARVARRHLGSEGRQARRILEEQASVHGLDFEQHLRAAYGATFAAPRADGRYDDWCAQVEAPEHDRLEALVAAGIGGLPRRPRVSVLLPTYDTDPGLLADCIESVLGQSYDDWELCIADDASPTRQVRDVIERFAARDARIRAAWRRDNGHISAASNSALSIATGELVALLDHDDRLPRHALLQVVEALGRHPDAKLLYTDEDKLDEGGRRTEPHFKPDHDRDLLLSQNYIGHLVVLDRELVQAVGGFREGFEGSQDHDLLLRCCAELRDEQVVHVPWIGYHWRRTAGSTAADAGEKRYTEGAGLQAVGEAVRRLDPGARAEVGTWPNTFRVRWPLPAEPPLVSILVPTRDRAALLELCMEGVLDRTRYAPLEVILIDNGSTEPTALELLARLGRDPRVRVVRDSEPFNFARLNNLAAETARGELLCLLNNDVEVIDAGWLGELVSHALRPGVGCVGAKLLYPDDRIQHAGVVLGIGGVAGHAHKYLVDRDHGYFSRPHLTQRVSAVTAACLVVRAALYRELGGLDAERLGVAFNDVDFCLRVREAGYRNVYTPWARLYHHESASRGEDTSGEKLARFHREWSHMAERWGAALAADPCYSRHLSLEHEDFSIRLPGDIVPAPPVG